MGDLIRLDEYRGQKIRVTTHRGAEPELFESLVEVADDGTIILYADSFLAEGDDAIGMTADQAKALARELLRLADQAEHC